MLVLQTCDRDSDKLIHLVILGLAFFFFQIRSTAKSRPLVDRLVNAITMVVMMGLTWIFGYFLLIPVNVAYETAMQWLFTIFNVFQVRLWFFPMKINMKTSSQLIQ